VAWPFTKNSDDQFYYEVACRVNEIVLADLVGEMPSNEELKSMYTFSEEFERKMSLIIDSIGRRRKIPKSVKRIIIIAAAIVALIVGALNASAILKSLHDLYLTCFEDYSIATYQDISDSDLSDGSDYVADNDVAVNITEHYEPSYVPEGYDKTNIVDIGAWRQIHYSNGVNKIYFTQSTLSSSMQLDTEDATVAFFSTSSFECCYVKFENEITLVFEKNGYVFKIEGMISTQTAIQMAQSIKLE